MISVVSFTPPMQNDGVKVEPGLGDLFKFDSDMTVNSGNIAPENTEKKKRGRPKKETIKESDAEVKYVFISSSLNLCSLFLL